MNAAHRALRDATAAAHERLDALFAGFDLTDRAAYAAFLQAHADAALPVEAALDAAGADRLLADWPTRKRGKALQADLDELSAPSETEVERDAEAPILDGSDASLAGALYVLEGSRLGGKFLARRLPGGFPRRYLDADQPRGNWAFLLARLETLLYEPSHMQSAIDAALATFARFEAAGRARLSRA